MSKIDKTGKDNIRKYIGAQLRCMRINAGLSIRESSVMSGYNQSNICNIENGRYSATIEVVAHLAKCYGEKIIINPNEIDYESN